ncbi:LAGLIDADG family homing endonuclease [Agrobacterium sp. 22-221-1]
MWLYSDQWAAGFFDGEGCIQIEPRKSGHGTSYYVNIQVTQNDRRPLDELQKRWGGNVTGACRRATDRCFRWRMSSTGAAVFLTAMLPYLLVKRERALLALEMRDLMGSKGIPATDAQRAARSYIYERFRETFV